MDNLKTKDNGEIEVQIAPIGQFNGSDSKGNPVPENLTHESLTALADKLNAGDEILCDVDHQSCRPGVEKDTSSAGWFSKFVVDPIRGMFAKLKLTKRGKDLVENREYRYLSPTFMLDENGSPVDLHSVSLTNLPAFRGSIQPILNTEPKKQDLIEMEITKEDLVSLIRETVLAMNTAPAEETEEKIEEKVENSEETQCEECQKAEEAENSCKDEEEVKNEESTEEKKDPEEKIEEAEPEKKDEEPEVIEKEALNSAPTPGYADAIDEKPWKNLHGKDFFKWLEKNKNNI